MPADNLSHFYILYSHTRNRFYIGHTSEQLEERLQKHNSKIPVRYF
ncbi:MAG: GIY-YIG nuclease family protein [Bacteroidota bacterium]